jgi:hypothetical protein
MPHEPQRVNSEVVRSAASRGETVPRSAVSRKGGDGGDGRPRWRFPPAENGEANG